MKTLNKTLTMTDLEHIFNQAIAFKAEYIGVKIQTKGYEKPEIIINPKENFEEKLDYYKSAYNENLTLKTFNGIKIVGIEYGYNCEEIFDYLNDNE